MEFSGGRGRRRRIEGPAIELLNYKDVGTLSKFMTEQGKILPKRTTKVTAAFQRKLGRAIKRARYLALIPYVRDHEA
ncbi:MAG: 30S ribosomal protein S18 [Gemmatimonadota bacterium]